jgi:catechol 2,3-dioxygenase-like lactoylglutathione lyase family enzyme
MESSMSLPALFGHHFQVAYVVGDSEAARGIFAERFGVPKWQILDMVALQGEESPVRTISNAYSGDVMVELIEPRPEKPSIYRDWTPEAKDGFRFHHLGFLVPTPEEFAATVERLEAAGFPTAMGGSFGDLLDYHYADVTGTLGHYYELVHLRPAGAGFFTDVPKN